MILLLPLLLSLLALGTSAGATNALAGQTWWDPAARPVPDSQINAVGAPFTGADSGGQVRGFVDAHVHLMSYEGFGGRLMCGQTFSPAGIADALKDCPEHYPDGSLDEFDFLTHGGDGRHDPVGWPTFKDWPAPASLTHNQTYYAWIERAWRGGQRVLVNDLVTNAVICHAYLFKDRSCDEMSAIRLEAKKTYDLQDYIDRMYGGPGKGWFRIVTDSGQAREVIKQGKLAVILGVETSEPFGCKQILDSSQCSREDIERGLDELYNLGVRSMFLCHKFDNALCGVRFDSGTLGNAINAGQFLSTGTHWKTEKCTSPEQDNPFGTHTTADNLCNTRGLTALGEYAVHAMMKRHMMLEIDHMSVKAVNQTFSILEAQRYPGVISSHSWMDPHWTERVYRLGGFIAQHINDALAFTAEERESAALRQKYHIVGYGIGTDMNGMSEQPGARGAGTEVQYPYRSPDGGTVLDRQTTGQRTWDINRDGVAHYGLLPDWVEDVRATGGQDVVNDLMSGAEGYLHTWGATEGNVVDQVAGCPDGMKPSAPVGKDIQYKAHVHNLGWQSFNGVNGTYAGTTGLSDSIEALRLTAHGSGGIRVHAHVQNIGWQPWQYAADGKQVEVGTTGQNLRLEALEIEVLSGIVGGRAHVQNVGWQPLTASSKILIGTVGQSLRMEAVALNLCT
ncbi:discoidin domain-containing protein [Streptomyces sp. 1222.5]|uniref:discoidin domain-containing protein n=1 Tax=Streptomyces sp. 1222.5 TaxID=1881026 RepID=UPI003D706D0E